MEDSKIIELYFQRDEQAISETDRKYGALCHTIALHILSDEQDAQECVNDAYLRLWHAIPPAEPSHFQAFVLTLTRRAALDRADQRSRKKRFGDRCSAALEELAAILPAPDDVQQQVEDSAVSEAVRRFLDALPEEHRTMLLRRYWYLQSSREIAREMGITESRVRVTLMRLRQKLRAYLEKEDLL